MNIDLSIGVNETIREFYYLNIKLTEAINAVQFVIELHPELA